MAVDVAVFMEEHGFTPEEAAVVTEETDHLEELILADDGDLEDIAESFLLLPRLRFLRVVREARAAAAADAAAAEVEARRAAAADARPHDTRRRGRPAAPVVCGRGRGAPGLRSFEGVVWGRNDSPYMLTRSWGSARSGFE